MTLLELFELFELFESAHLGVGQVATTTVDRLDPEFLRNSLIAPISDLESFSASLAFGVGQVAILAAPGSFRQIDFSFP
jgi:hypothetical protein